MERGIGRGQVVTKRLHARWIGTSHYHSTPSPTAPCEDTVNPCRPAEPARNPKGSCAGGAREGFNHRALVDFERRRRMIALQLGPAYLAGSHEWWIEEVDDSEASGEHRPCRRP